MKEVNVKMVFIINIILLFMYSLPLINLHKVPYGEQKKTAFILVPIIVMIVGYFFLLFELKIFDTINAGDDSYKTFFYIAFTYIYTQILLLFNCLFQYIGRNKQEIIATETRTLQPCFNFIKNSALLYIIFVFGILIYLSC